MRVGLRGAAVVAATVLGGCAVRLEDDAPPVPFIPRKSIDDEALLVDGYRQARALAALAAAVPGSELARTLVAHHERQASVLRGVLTNGGVPGSVVEPSATGSSSPATTPSAPPTTATLAAAEVAALAPEALEQLSNAVAQRPLLTAITAHRASAAALLGATPAWSAHPGLPADAAATALEPSREAGYATEAAAARVASTERAPFLDLLGALQRRMAALRSAAGAQADTGPLAYRLPFGVTTADDARRLVRTVLDGLVARGLDVLPVLPVGSAAVSEVARLQAEAAVLRQRWGGPLTPFPGLVDG